MKWLATCSIAGSINFLQRSPVPINPTWHGRARNQLLWEREGAWKGWSIRNERETKIKRDRAGVKESDRLRQTGTDSQTEQCVCVVILRVSNACFITVTYIFLSSIITIIYCTKVLMPMPSGSFCTMILHPMIIVFSIKPLKHRSVDIFREMWDI